MELCDCPQCIKFEFTDNNGKTTQGVLVSQRTRNRHWAKHSQSDQLSININPKTTPSEHVDAREGQKRPDQSDESRKLDHFTGDAFVELSRLMLFFIAWLYVVGGMSRDKCQVARRYLISIINLARRLNNENYTQPQIPQDVRTVVKKFDLMPQLHQYVCCPKCYSSYDIETAPLECQYKNFPTSLPCGVFLFHPIRFTRPLPHIKRISMHYSRPQRNHQKRRPFSLYVTQDFTNWLRWFVPQAEKSIEDWKEALITTSNDIHDYQQSPAWEALYPQLQQNPNSTTLKLAFSLFTDWFNPLSNKASGKQVSLGVLALNCLNLPPTSRWKTNNTFLSGLVPEPSQPNMVTINNILTIFIDEIALLDSGIIIQTPQYPNGRKVVVRLGCLIGDLVANHKVAGFASHSATRFCSWCECVKADIQHLKLGRLRQKRIVKDCSHQFKELRNEAECTRMVKKTGIRWSELNRLHYWDPVQQIPLGIMHNWFEGILQHHFRNRWRWDLDKLVQDENQTDDHDTEDDFEMQDCNTSGLVGLSWDRAHKMMSALRSVTVPFGVTRIPHWLGQAKEGKIKASEWHSLFAIYLPLAAIDNLIGDLEKFTNDPNEATKMLLLVDNFSALVSCTHILEARSITSSDCSRFREEYQRYCDSSKKLFKVYAVNPNHHYALHIEMHLRHWGPLIGIAEFSGERLNGILQRIPTSGQIGKFGLTIMTSFCQWQRLIAKNKWEISEQQQDDKQVDFEMDHNTYLKILSHLQIKAPNLRNYSHIPHPDGANVLLNYAKELKTITRKGYLIGNSKPNNMIQYNSPGKICFGIVVHILKVMQDGLNDELLIVKHLDVAKSRWDEEKWLKGILRKVEVVHLKQVGIDEIVPSINVLATCAYRDLSAGTLGCQEPSVLVHVIQKSPSWFQ
ncbi:hypothetical protein O181_009031 [Austropuccinia psidii MF-1]|uniref:Uncharacterized protein n=1 Tax=Austropuccinia psidii MF-1 TaxID=1389203 RepID=A0A9Q3GJ33_9BASI|nr:hypothetical protein [Austropuccinia psidii MF-1]